MECSDCLFPYCSIFASIVDQARKLADEQGSSWKEVLNNTETERINTGENYLTFIFRRDLFLLQPLTLKRQKRRV